MTEIDSKFAVMSLIAIAVAVWLIAIELTNISIALKVLAGLS